MSSDSEKLIEDDEIDLVKLIKGLWQQKMLIVAMAAMVALAALVYVLVATPIYEAKVFVQPPTQEDIAYLNYGRGGETDLDRLSVKDVYDAYLRNLQSEFLRRNFYQRVYLPTLSAEEREGSQDRLYRNFSKLLVVSGTGKNTPDRYVVTVALPNPKDAADWAAGYAKMAGDIAKQEILNNIRSEAAVRANNLQFQITNAQKSAREQREDEILKLKEALAVAKAIGLEKSSIMFGNMSSDAFNGAQGSLSYLHGSKALSAEIENLENRKSDDPFITDIRKQQAALAFYRSLDVDPVAVATYRQDGVVESPDQPVKPNKSLIVLAGFIIGTLAGIGFVVGLVLWREAISPKFGDSRR